MRTQGKITVRHGGKEYTVRVLKVQIPAKEGDGYTETLLTSLNQKQLPVRNAGALYFERWKVETAYDLKKSKLELENFSGKTKVSVEQDFYATMYLANLVAFAAEEANAIIEENDRSKNLRYPRKASYNRAISKLRDDFMFLLLEPDAKVRKTAFDRMTRSIARYPMPVVPGRSPARKKPRKKRFHMARKSVV